MKLARTLVAAMVVALIGLCAGCSVKLQPLTPAQKAAIVCPAMKSGIQQIELVASPLAALPGAIKAESILQRDVGPIVTSVCAHMETATSNDILTLTQSVLPAVGQAIAALPIPPADQLRLQGGFAAAEVVLGVVGVVQQQINAAQPATVNPATTSTVAAPAK